MRANASATSSAQSPGRQKTANAWLANHDAHRIEVLEVLSEAYGKDAALWNQRWRMFWMACAELFGYRGHNAWLVGHYHFVKKASDSVL